MALIIDRVSPFCVGKEAVGEGFVGRDSQIDEYSHKLFSSNGGGNVSICGLPRIGKSSLARRVLDAGIAGADDKLLIANVGSLGACQTFYGLCKRIARLIKRELRRLGAEEGVIVTLVEELGRAGNEYEEYSCVMEELFEALADEGYKTIVYIDEFDYVDRVFSLSTDGDSICYFQLLRSLISEPVYNVSMLLVSRRSLSLLEERSCGASTFHGVFDNHQLAGFTNAEVGQMRALLERYGGTVDDDEWAGVLHLTGGVPYLLSLVCNDLLVLRNKKTVMEILNGCEQRVYGYCKDIVDLLEDEDTLKHLVQVCIGPRYDIIPQQVSELESKGYIVSTEMGYEPVCGYFDEYLRSIVQTGRELDIYPLLTRAEKKLRVIIEFVLDRKYGCDWAEIVRSEYEVRCKEDYQKYHYFVDFQKAYKFLEINRKRFGVVSDSFLSVISIAELSQMLRFYWPDFAPVFNGSSYSEWEPRLKLLQRARDPLAHSNLDYLTSEEIDRANNFCKEILALKLE